MSMSIDVLKPYLAWVRITLYLVLVAVAFLSGYRVAEWRNAAQVAGMRQASAEQMAAATQEARADEHKQADGFAAIDTKFSGDMRYAQALSASTVAGLHDGSIRLSRTWQCPAARPAAGVPAPAADSGAVATEDRLRQESAGRIVRAVTELQAERDRALDKLAAERK